MEAIIKRIKLLIKDLQIPEKDLHKKIGMGQRTVNYYLNENRKPNIEFVTKIASSYPDINLDWLITGEGTMLKSASETRAPANESALLEKIAMQDKTIEKLEIKIEKLETTNEKLQTTNEKLIATNEKLATSNERLVNKIGRLSTTASTSFLDAVEDV